MSRQIDNNTRFIVFDMEWNQPIGGKEYDFEVSELPGEIIEIGAASYSYRDGVLRKNGIFHAVIRPVCYTKLHFHVKKVTHKTNKDLIMGEPFAKVYENFRKFCGDNAILAGWGDSDPDMLKKNLKFFKMDSELKMDFLDIQPLFSIFTDDVGKQRSVEYAVDYYNLAKVASFHSAMADADYTGDILRMIYKKNDCAKVNEAISKALTNPDNNIRQQFVGSESESAEDALAEAVGFGGQCPICGVDFKVEIPTFRIRKNMYALMDCEDHGGFFMKTRVKKSKSGKYYSAALLRPATASDHLMVLGRFEEYREYGIEGKPVEIVNKPEEEE